MNSSNAEQTVKTEENVVNSSEFTTNLMLFWLKAKFTLTTKRINGFTPNTILGLIPLGKNEITFPTNKIAGVSVSTKFHLSRLLIGGFVFLFGLGLLSKSFFLAILVILFGLGSLLNCYTSRLMITNNAGQSPNIEISILEKSKLQNFANEINDSIVN